MFTVNQLADVYYNYLAKYDEQPRCRGQAYLYWDCCDVHRELNAQSKQCSEAAKNLNIISEGCVLSAQWWADAGRPDLYDNLVQRWYRDDTN